MALLIILACFEKFPTGSCFGGMVGGTHTAANAPHAGREVRSDDWMLHGERGGGEQETHTNQ